MTVVRNMAETFDVVDRHRVIESGFTTSAVAWRWIDRHEGDRISPADKRTAWFVGGMLRGDL